MALVDVLCILSDSVSTIVLFVLFFIGSLPYIHPSTTYFHSPERHLRIAVCDADAG